MFPRCRYSLPYTCVSMAAQPLAAALLPYERQTARIAAHAYPHLMRVTELRASEPPQYWGGSAKCINLARAACSDRGSFVRLGAWKMGAA